MLIVTSTTLIVITFFSSIVAGIVTARKDDNNAPASYLSMLCNAHSGYDPAFQMLARKINARKLAPRNGRRLQSTTTTVRQLETKSKTTKASTKKVKSTKKETTPPTDLSTECNPEIDVRLDEFKQWKDETGYWIGEYSYYDAANGGAPFQSASWPYLFGDYRGFITGNILGHKYRQRNVFMYPPQSNEAICSGNKPIVGDGVCGTNGNTKVFEADQAATTCDEGNIEGPYSATYTYTTLVGQDNAVLYQVYFPGYLVGDPTGPDRLFQSQLTTITKTPPPSNSTIEGVRRTRTAQSFDVFAFPGTPSQASYYRERKVSREEFYEELAKTQEAYNIRSEDLCKWKDNDFGQPEDILDGEPGSLGACEAHLEESFADDF